MVRAVVLGAGGYLGRRLIDRLVARGWSPVAVTRRPTDFGPRVRAVCGDVGEAGVLDGILRPGDVIYYLVHSLGETDFESADRRRAWVVAAAAERAQAARIVYVGGPRPRGDAVDGLSAHLRSRAEVGDVLLGSSVPAIVLQASMIVGSGSLSFELLRRLAQRLPVLPAPRWMSRHSRPVAERDVLHYLVAAADPDLTGPVEGRFDVAGPESVSYLDLVRRCARTAMLPARPAVAFPAWSHRLSAHLAATAAPVSPGVANALFTSLDYDLDQRDRPVTDVLPPPPGGPTTLDNALREAHGLARDGAADGTRTFVDEKTVRCRRPPGEVWDVILSSGGRRGWHTLPGAWALRGVLDHAIGGVGLYRGRPERLSPGDVVDFWTVVSRDDATRELVLRADMKMPGTTELRMAVDTTGEGSQYRQTVTFRPDGIAGTLYWTLQKPLHDIVFTTMAHVIAGTLRR